LYDNVKIEQEDLEHIMEETEGKESKTHGLGIVNHTNNSESVFNESSSFAGGTGSRNGNNLDHTANFEDGNHSAITIENITNDQNSSNHRVTIDRI
jgi:hypothetical protein